MEQASVIAINRHRINSDGQGVRTLVALEGCNLHCKYCINTSCIGKGKGTMMTTEQLYQQLVKDDLYFMATNGGVTFGGGEPLLWSDFIKEFIEKYGYEIDVTIETSLNIPFGCLQNLEDVGHASYIVDIKDMNRHIYEKYTGKNILPMLENLEWLVNKCHYGVKVRVPHIPGYNTDEDVKKSITVLADTFDDFTIDEFNYLTDADVFEKEHAYEIGKYTCKTLRKIREKIAELNGIDYKPGKCESRGVCSGSCQMCDSECDFLRRKLIEKYTDSHDLENMELTNAYRDPLPENEYDNKGRIIKVKHHLDGRRIDNVDDMIRFQEKYENESWLWHNRLAELNVIKNKE